jgi:two-component system, OmpR family, sensor histidine kinase MprB
MRRLTLRSRLALLSAVAVAVAIAAVAATSWFVVSDRLYNQLDSSIASTPSPMQHGSPLHPSPPSPITLCWQVDQTRAQSDGNPDPLFGQGFQTGTVLIQTDGKVCPVTTPRSITADPAINPTAADVAAAKNPGSGTSYFYDATATTGQAVRVQVVVTPQATYLKYQPTDIEAELSGLAWLMVGISGLGTAGAALAGLFIARRALRPVDHLTKAVEYVARTENLAVRIPVNGNDEIARLGRAFNKMTKSLYMSRDEQKRLIDDAGHELRTPLTSLRTTIDLLIRSDETGRPLPETTRTQLLTGARAQMRELTTLIRDLLDLSQPEQARSSATPLEPVDFGEIAERAVERVRPRGAALAEPVSIDASLKPWITRGDEAGLERAVVNLLDNAVKFSPPNGTVEVSLVNGTLTVRDHGPGIAREELPHVFERFWRSPSARAMPGSGLGLAIAARAVREAGGEISLVAATDGGTGTVARIKLPGSATPVLR